MRGMCFHYHRAAGGESGSRISPRDREGEREIAGAEDRNRAEWDMPLSQVGAGEWLAVRYGVVDARVLPAALANHFSK